MRTYFNVVEVVVVLLLLALPHTWVWGMAVACENTAGGIGQMLRPHSVTITEFGAVGDGLTLNTKAFQNAIFYLNSFSDKGGAKLFVPAGRWLTGSFELISHLTLWLDNDAVIVGSPNSGDWPLTDPLPSYGRGRELPGGRHRSLIFGHNLTDVVLAGDNGTIDGQGNIWWNWFETNTLNYTRPHLVEFINSTGIAIRNLTFIDSPFWAIHPVYCSHVTVKNVRILAPAESPNTDGIDPDSSDNVCIEDCYISTGDDLVAVKSGWDEYGVSYGHPSTNIVIRRLTGKSGKGAAIAIGSEMSGGVSHVVAQHIRISNSATAFGIKTSPGRGGYVRNVYVSNLEITNVHTAVRFTGQFGEHPDEFYDPNALPVIERITIKDVTGERIKLAGVLQGLKGDTFRDVCFSNITLSITSTWNCSHVQGFSELVAPEICESLNERICPHHFSNCYHLSNTLLSW